jgi:hypothetical protein
MAAELTRLTHKIAIQLHLMEENCTICSSHSRRPVRKLLDIIVFLGSRNVTACHSIKSTHAQSLTLRTHLAKLKNAWNYTSIPPICLHVFLLTEHHATMVYLGSGVTGPRILHLGTS